MWHVFIWGTWMVLTSCAVTGCEERQGISCACSCCLRYIDGTVLSPQVVAVRFRSELHSVAISMRCCKSLYNALLIRLFLRGSCLAVPRTYIRICPGVSLPLCWAARPPHRPECRTGPQLSSPLETSFTKCKVNATPPLKTEETNCGMSQAAKIARIVPAGVWSGHYFLDYGRRKHRCKYSAGKGPRP